MKQKKRTLLTLLLSVLTFTISAQSTAERVPKLRIGFSGGIGYKTAAGSSDNNTVINKDKIAEMDNAFRWTPLMNGDIHFLFKSGWGVGAKYIFNHSSSRVEDVIMDIMDNMHYISGDVSETMYLNYGGLSAFGYQFLGSEQRMMLTSSFSAGYAHLRDETNLIGYRNLMTGNGLGLNYELGLDYFLSSSFAVGAKMAFFMANFNKVKIEDGVNSITVNLDKDNRINASNLNIQIGISYYLNK